MFSPNSNLSNITDIFRTFIGHGPRQLVGHTEGEG